MKAIRSREAMGKIVDKFLRILDHKDTKVTKHNKRFYYISYGQYILSIAEDCVEDDYVRLQFKFKGEVVCVYNFTLTKDERMYSKVCDWLLGNCDSILNHNKAETIIQEFLDNN